MLSLALAAAAPGLVALAAALRGRAGLLLFVPCLSLPAFVDPPLLRVPLALFLALALMRVIDLTRDARLAAAPLRRRLWHAFSAVDSRLLRPAPRRLDGRRALRFLVWSALSAAGLWLALQGGASRWAGGVVLTYAFVESLWALLAVLYVLAGFHTPPLHELPLLSSSIQELWGVRWAQVIRQWMQMNVVRVWARRRSLRVGLLLAFAVSGLGHAYLVLVTSGPALALSMLAFFVLQGFAVLVEERLHVRGWPRPLRHAWVLSVMLSTSPLFVGATLACLGL